MNKEMIRGALWTLVFISGFFTGGAIERWHQLPDAGPEITGNTFTSTTTLTMLPTVYDPPEAVDYVKTNEIIKRLKAGKIIGLEVRALITPEGTKMYMQLEGGQSSTDPIGEIMNFQYMSTTSRDVVAQTILQEMEFRKLLWN